MSKARPRGRWSYADGGPTRAAALRGQRPYAGGGPTRAAALRGRRPYAGAPKGQSPFGIPFSAAAGIAATLPVSTQDPVRHNDGERVGKVRCFIAIFNALTSAPQSRPTSKMPNRLRPSVCGTSPLPPKTVMGKFLKTRGSRRILPLPFRIQRSPHFFFNGYGSGR